MHPITIEHLARIRMEELHREAEQHRLTSQFRTAAGTSTRIRTTAGEWLISVGERLLPDASIPTVGTQH